MAETPAKKKRVLRKVETVRERSTKTKAVTKTRRLDTAKKHVKRPIKTALAIGKKEDYLPLPNTKAGKFLNKKRHIVPTFLKESFAELKQVEWPTKKATFNLSVAVFVFAFFFGLMVSVVDYGLDKLFKELIIK